MIFCLCENYTIMKGGNCDALQYEGSPTSRQSFLAYYETHVLANRNLRRVILCFCAVNMVSGLLHQETVSKVQCHMRLILSLDAEDVVSSSSSE